MRKTTRFVTSWRMALAILLMGSLWLVACGGGQPAEVAVAPTSAPTEEPAAPLTEAPTEPPPTEAPTEPPPTEAPTEPPPTEAPTEPPPTEAPTEPPPTAAPEPTEEPEPEPEVIDDTACIGCHTDEETLKAVATEEEKPEVESEGEG